MRIRSGLVLARTMNLLCVVLLFAVVMVVAGCGSGPFGLATEEDDKRVADEKAWDKTIADTRAEKAKSGEIPDDTVMKYEEGAEDPLVRPEGEPVLIWKAGNDGGIEGGGGKPPTVKQDRAYFVTEVCAYHWNNGKGSPAGEITLKAADGTTYGPWKTTLRSEVYWIAQPNQNLPAGTYTLIDSDPSTWAQNSGSGGKGMGWAYGIPVK